MRSAAANWNLPEEFVHIPRTGGTSVARALGIEQDHRIALMRRARLSDDWPLRFTFIRNPYDRLVSIWARAKYLAKQSEANMKFSEWAKRGCPLPPPRPEVVERDWGTWFEHNLLSQLPYICDTDGRIIVDFVGRFERLQGDFDIVCDRLNVARRPLPRQSASPHAPYWTYYDREAREIVAKTMCEELEVLGYGFME